jgi:DNA-binding transcriptional regulator of glucitol operon
MAVTTGQSGAPAEARWHLLLRPRWLTWHAFVVVSTVGMLLLGDWQLHRAESGNSLSWAYTFEWPLFAAFTIYFWIKSLRDELRGQGASASAGSDSAAQANPAAGMSTEDPATWDSTSWDATRREASADGAAQPADVARATPADGEAYVARLMAEVQRSGGRRSRR